MLLAELLKQIELNEMSYFIDQEMKPNTIQWEAFYSSDTLQRDFILVKNGGSYAVYINKDHNVAVIGEMGNRPEDGKPGLIVFITAEFKDNQILTHDDSVPQLPGALQVDVVEARVKSLKAAGYGTKLYQALVASGITIISDNTQYRGGKALWIALGKQAGNGYVVNIIDHGKVKLDATGKPYQWNGGNIPEEELWSARGFPRTGANAPPVDTSIPDRTMTLFVMRKA
jgi:hypothetical protein